MPAGEYKEVFMAQANPGQDYFSRLPESVRLNFARQTAQFICRVKEDNPQMWAKIQEKAAQRGQQ